MKNDLKEFVNKATGRNFSLNVNFAFAAIWHLSSSGDMTVDIPINNLMILATYYQEKYLGEVLYNDAIWNDVLQVLTREDFIDMDSHCVKIKPLAVTLIGSAA